MSYFLYINKEVRGPYSEAELLDMLAHREIEPNILSSRGEDSEWLALDSALGLTSRQSPNSALPQGVGGSALSSLSKTHETRSNKFSSENRGFQPMLAESLPVDRTRLWNVASGLVVAYAVLVILSAFFYQWWNGEFDDRRAMLRLITRSIACFSVAHGLMHFKSWAFWTAACSSCLLTVFGIAGFVLLLDNNSFFERPYPYVDLSLFLLTISVTLALFVVLTILPFRMRK